MVAEVRPARPKWVLAPAGSYRPKNTFATPFQRTCATPGCGKLWQWKVAKGCASLGDFQTDRDPIDSRNVHLSLGQACTPVHYQTRANRASWPKLTPAPIYSGYTYPPPNLFCSYLPHPKLSSLDLRPTPVRHGIHVPFCALGKPWIPWIPRAPTLCYPPSAQSSKDWRLWLFSVFSRSRSTK